MKQQNVKVFDDSKLILMTLGQIDAQKSVLKEVTFVEFSGTSMVCWPLRRWLVPRPMLKPLNPSNQTNHPSSFSWRRVVRFNENEINNKEILQHQIQKYGKN